MSKQFVPWILVIILAAIGIYLIWSGQSSQSIPVSTSANTTSTVPAHATGAPAVLTKDGVPATLGTLSLKQSTLGVSALTDFAQLYGNGFELIGGYRADYSSADGQATVWVGQTKGDTFAQSLLDSLTQKIGPGDAGFQNLQSLDISGRTLYSADGKGKKDFFFAVNDKIVWLAADPTQASDVLVSLWGAIK